jgi:hypothetical protein
MKWTYVVNCILVHNEFFWWFIDRLNPWYKSTASCVIYNIYSKPFAITKHIHGRSKNPLDDVDWVAVLTAGLNGVAVPLHSKLHRTGSSWGSSHYENYATDLRTWAISVLVSMDTMMHWECVGWSMVWLLLTERLQWLQFCWQTTGLRSRSNMLERICFCLGSAGTAGPLVPKVCRLCKPVLAADPLWAYAYRRLDKRTNKTIDIGTCRRISQQWPSLTELEPTATAAVCTGCPVLTCDWE